MAIKQEVKVQKIEKKIRQKIIVAEGGKMNSDIPFKIIHSEFVESTPAAKERVKELAIEFPNNDISYFSV